MIIWNPGNILLGPQPKTRSDDATVSGDGKETIIQKMSYFNSVVESTKNLESIRNIGKAIKCKIHGMSQIQSEAWNKNLYINWDFFNFWELWTNILKQGYMVGYWKLEKPEEKKEVKDFKEIKTNTLIDGINVPFDLISQKSIGNFSDNFCMSLIEKIQNSIR